MFSSCLYIFGSINNLVSSTVLKKGINPFNPSKEFVLTNFQSFSGIFYLLYYQVNKSCLGLTQISYMFPFASLNKLVIFPFQSHSNMAPHICNISFSLITSHPFTSFRFTYEFLICSLFKFV